MRNGLDVLTVPELFEIADEIRMRLIAAVGEVAPEPREAAHASNGADEVEPFPDVEPAVDASYRAWIRWTVRDGQPRSTGQIGKDAVALNPRLKLGSFGREVATMLVKKYLVKFDDNGPQGSARYVKGPTP